MSTFYKIDRDIECFILKESPNIKHYNFNILIIQVYFKRNVLFQFFFDCNK